MKLKKWIVAALAIVTTVGLLAGCGADASKSVAPAEKNEIIVGINPGYGDQIMDVVKQEAAKQGLKVNVKAFNDYITPNQALANGDIDLNVYQHQPFLDAFNAKNGTNIVSIGKTYLAPLALYSHKYKKVADIPDGSTIAILACEA